MWKKFNRIFLILFTAILFISCNNLEKNKIASEGNIEIKSDNSSVSIVGADIKAGKNVLIRAKDKVELKAGEEELKN